jgi:hypothetical protein
VTPELEALSRRLVPLWKWRGGERWRFDIPTVVWSRYEGDDLCDSDGALCREAEPQTRGPVLLDLTDPATVGCLLVLVREILGCPDMSTRSNVTVFGDVWTSGPWAVVSTSRHVSIDVATGPTEAIALCNAILLRRG